MTSATPPPSAPLPLAVSCLLMLAVVAGALGLALAAERQTTTETRHVVSAEKTLIRDVLTGRLTRADGTPEPPVTGPGSAGAPLRLRFVPSSDAAQAEAAIAGMLDFLRRRTGYVIEGAILRSYGLVVTAITEGDCDVAFLTAASYARAVMLANQNGRTDDDVEAILAAVRRGHAQHPGSDLAYRAAILVRRDSPLQSVAELDGRTVAMGNRTSGASSILPSALFNEMGLTPRIQRYEGYPIIINAVLQGATEAGCIWWSPPNADNPENDARITIQSTHPDIFKTTRIIGFTQWIPNEPVVVRGALDADVKNVLRRAIPLYVAGRVATREGRKELEAIGSVLGYIPATNDDFAPLMEVIKRAFAGDPEGRRDFMSSRR